MQLNITNPPLLKNTLAVNQMNTVLNTPGTYNVADFFKDLNSRPISFKTPVQSDGTDLPSWVVWDATNKVFTFNTGAIQSVDIKVVGYVTLPQVEKQHFSVNISNNPPVVISPMGSDSQFDNFTYSYTQDISTVFSEPDPLQTLTYTVNSDN